MRALHKQTSTRKGCSSLGRAGLEGLLLDSCSPSLTGSKGEARGCEGGLKRGRMEGKVMRRPGECFDRDPARAMPAATNHEPSMQSCQPLHLLSDTKASVSLLLGMLASLPI